MFKVQTSAQTDSQLKLQLDSGCLVGAAPRRFYVSTADLRANVQDFNRLCAGNWVKFEPAVYHKSGQVSYSTEYKRSLQNKKT